MEEKTHQLIESMYVNIWEAEQLLGIYKSLYGSTLEVVEMLNSSAGHYFAAMGRMIPDYIVIILCRVLDPASQGRFQNATLEALLGDVQDDVLRKSLGEILDAARVHADRLREARNKRIAHLDQNHQSTFNSAGFKLDELHKTLELIHEFLLKLSQSYGQMYHIKPNNASSSLLAALAKARHYDQLVLENRISHRERSSVVAPFYRGDD